MGSSGLSGVSGGSAGVLWWCALVFGVKQNQTNGDGQSREAAAGRDGVRLSVDRVPQVA